MNIKVYPIYILLMVCSIKMNAAVAVSRLISNNMVLQRGVKSHIWGTASAGESIRLMFKGKQYRVVADGKGAWSVMLDAASAGGPYSLSIKGKTNAIEISNLLIGDVWVCSGQSNMQFTVLDAKNAAAEIAGAADPGIRHFKVPNVNGEIPQSQLNGGEWLESSSATAGGFTAVGYFFAREMRKLHPDVPIGLINSSWGGTRIETWMSYAGFGWKGVEDLKKYHENEYARRVNVLKENNNWLPTETDAGIEKGLPIWVATNYDDASWKELKVPGWWWGNGLELFGGVLWMRKSFDLPADVASGEVALSLGVFDDRAKVWINGNLIDSTNNRSGKIRQYMVPSKYLNVGKNTVTLQAANLDAGGSLGGKDALKISSKFYQQSLAGNWKYRIGKFDYAPQSQPLITPTGLFNTMISPLTAYTIKGALWYQGESNASDLPGAYHYRSQLTAMVKDWRSQFHSGDFPFIVVQLPNYSSPAVEPGVSNWAILRESQYQVLNLPNTALVNTIDLGEADDIHPLNKQDVGKRLATAVRKFDERDLETGPVFKSMEQRGDSVLITFAAASGGLMTKNRYGYVTGFAIAGADKKFVWAKARIEGSKVIVWSEKVKSPLSVRYAWANNPAEASLYSIKGSLPAFPFRTDDWDPIMY